MWPAILGMTFAHPAASRAGLAGGLILGAAGLGNAVGPLLGGIAHRRAGLALGLLPQPADRRVRLLRHLAERPPRGGPLDRADRLDYLGVATLSLGLVSLPPGARPGLRLGLDRPGDPRRSLPLAAVLLAAFARDRAAGGRAGARPGATCSRNRGFVAACVAVLLMSAIFFSALLYLPQFMTMVLGYSALESGAGLLPMMGTFAITSFLAGPLYERLGPKLDGVRRRRAPRASGCSCSRSSSARDGYPRPRARHGRARHRRRALLLVDHDRGGDRAGSVAGEPGRRHRLHVPDRRRLGRPRPEHGDRRLELADRRAASAAFLLDAGLALLALSLHSPTSADDRRGTRCTSAIRSCAALTPSQG